MCDSSAPSLDRVHAQLSDPRCRARLIAIALRITGSPASADDLVNDAIMLVLDPEGFPWKKWTFMTHMTFAMRHVWDEQRRRFSVKKEIPDENVTLGLKGLSREPPADDELDRRRWLATLRQLAQRVLAKLDGQHPRARQCFNLAVQGIEQPAEQASAIPRPVAEVYEAHRILRRYASPVRKEWEREEEQRMREQRATWDREQRKVQS